MEQIRASRRLLSYVILAAIMAAGYVVLGRISTWRGESDFFQLLQTSAVLLSLVVGILALVRYSTQRNTTMLFFAAGFIGAAAFDLAHIVITSPFAIAVLPSSPSALYAWGWTISRLFVSVMLFLSWLSWWAERHWHSDGQLSEGVVYVVTTILLSASVVGFGFVVLPELHRPDAFLVRPWELLPAVFFAAALVGYLAKGEWRHKYFDHWVILMLVVSLLTQLILSTVSFEVFDATFYGAYISKNISLWLLFTGVLTSVASLFRRVTRSEDLLTSQNVALTEAKVDLQAALQHMKLKEEELAQKISELQQAWAKDAAVLDSIGDGLVATDDDTRIIMVNRGFQSLMGYAPDEVHGQPVTAVVKVEDEDGALVPYEKRAHPVALFTGQRVTERLRHYYRRKDGSRFPVSVTVTPVAIEGQTIGAVEVFRDVTPEKEVDRSKTEFVSLASHQLRTPLTSINWYAEMILDGDSGEITPTTRDYVQEISTGTIRMSKLVGALLNVSRIDMGTFAIQPEPTDVSALIADVIRELEPQIHQKALVVKTTSSLDQSTYDMDPNLLRIIFQNLLTNAVKYTPSGGRITVTAEDTNSVLRFSVRDTGCGIPAHQHDRIFQKLFRADNVRMLETDGTGLGLYLVKSILDEAGGRVWFESEVDKGSTFFVELPRSGMKPKHGNHSLAPGDA